MTAKRGTESIFTVPQLHFDQSFKYSGTNLHRSTIARPTTHRDVKGVGNAPEDPNSKSSKLSMKVRGLCFRQLPGKPYSSLSDLKSGSMTAREDLMTTKTPLTSSRVMVGNHQRERPVQVYPARQADSEHPLWTPLQPTPPSYSLSRNAQVSRERPGSAASSAHLSSSVPTRRILPSAYGSVASNRCTAPLAAPKIASLVMRPPKLSDFDTIGMIGQGGYAIVRVVRHAASGEVFALKQMAKCDLKETSQAQMIANEIRIMYKAYYETAERITRSSASQHLGTVELWSLVALSKPQWVPRLYNAWEDDLFVYMLMEYLPGGDMMKHLIDLQVFSEDSTKIYIAQLVLAVEYMHDVLGWAHRDIKPDNILLDIRGHLKLVDFGLSKQLPSTFMIQPKISSTGKQTAVMQPGVSKARERLGSVVGTPDYMAPEVHRGEAYDRRVDWWSVGVIMYEMLFGGPPLSDPHHRSQITAKIIRNWSSFFPSWPNRPHISDDCKHFIQTLICEKHMRPFSGSTIRQHRWFRDVEWSHLLSTSGPISPKVSGVADLSNFDKFPMSTLLEWENTKRRIRCVVGRTSIPRCPDINNILSRHRPLKTGPSQQMSSPRDIPSHSQTQNQAQISDSNNLSSLAPGSASFHPEDGSLFARRSYLEVKSNTINSTECGDSSRPATITSGEFNSAIYQSLRNNQSCPDETINSTSIVRGIRVTRFPLVRDQRPWYSGTRLRAQEAENIHWKERANIEGEVNQSSNLVSCRVSASEVPSRYGEGTINTCSQHSNISTVAPFTATPSMSSVITPPISQSPSPTQSTSWVVPISERPSTAGCIARSTNHH